MRERWVFSRQRRPVIITAAVPFAGKRDAMSLCPRCDQRLVRTKVPQGVVFLCPRCKGRAVGLAVLRRTVPEAVVKGLWLHAHEDGGPAGADCPICRRPMVRTLVPTQQQPVVLEVCTACQFTWFGPGVLNPLPAAAEDRAGAVAGKGPRANRVLQIKSYQQRQARADALDGETPEETWKWIPAMLGMPVEIDVHPLRCWPWLTWGLATAIALVYVFTMNHLRPVVEEFGLVPNQLWRHAGLTFLTSFFLHGGLLHVIGNAYFLLIFGGRVEDQIGRGR